VAGPIQAANLGLKRFLRSPKAYRAHLPPDVYLTWLSGGCWLLAEALRRVLGGKLVALGSRGGQVEHVLLLQGEWLVDGDGFSRERTVLRRWREKEGVADPAIWLFDSVAYAGEIPRPPEADVHRLQHDLRAVLGAD